MSFLEHDSINLWYREYLEQQRVWKRGFIFGRAIPLRQEIEKHSTALPQNKTKILWLHEHRQTLLVWTKWNMWIQNKTWHSNLFFTDVFTQYTMTFPLHPTTFKQHKHKPHETPFIQTDNDSSSLCIWRQIQTDNNDSKQIPCVNEQQQSSSSL